MKTKCVNFNKLYLVILFLVLILLLPIKANCQTLELNDSIKRQIGLAKKLQYGINCDVNTERAAKIYAFWARKQVPVAMTELAKMYKNGEGVPQDYNSCLNLLRRSSELGYTEASYLLGLMYHKGEGVKQSFSLAYKYYEQSLKGHNPKGYYGVGYLLYKGLGVVQDYHAAIKYFEKGAEMGHEGCNYMLATYYLSGYGGSVNEGEGRKYLNEAIKSGHRWTLDISKYNMVDSLVNRGKIKSNSWSDIKTNRIKTSKESIANNIIQNEKLQGKWKGKLYTYDWSGKKIINEEDIVLTFNNNEEITSMNWSNSTGEIAEFIGKYDKELWKASGKQKKISNWFVHTAKFEMRSTNSHSLLYADFTRISRDTREPLKPCIAILEQIVEKEKSIPLVINKLYPTPFENEIMIEFESYEKQHLYYEIYDVMGNLVYKNNGENYGKGVHYVSLQITLDKGNYILYIKGNNFTVSENIIHK